MRGEQVVQHLTDVMMAGAAVMQAGMPTQGGTQLDHERLRQKVGRSEPEQCVTLFVFITCHHGLNLLADVARSVITAMRVGQVEGRLNPERAVYLDRPSSKSCIAF